MPKFFVEPNKVRDNIILIDTEDVSHIIRVLRMKQGDKITICDSCGWDYDAQIIEVSDKCIKCSVINKSKSDTEPDVEVVLYQALPKASKMEYIIQKTTELGINEIRPVSTSRCVVKIDNKKDAQKKAVRWQKIAESAAKQSGRGIIPRVSEPITFKQAVEELSNYDMAFVPYECEETNTIKNEIAGLSGKQRIAYIIGPEGGFSTEEIQELTRKGIKTVTLGRRILRTETAGEAVLTMIMYETNEFQY